MKRLLGLSLGWFALLLPASASAGLVGSTYGADYETFVSVTYDPNAPTSNFGSPGTTTSGDPYRIYTAADATNAYILLQTTSGASSLPFANVYVDTVYPDVSNGSNLLFELTNNRLANPGQPGYRSLDGTGYQFNVSADGGTIEAKIPFATVFANMALTQVGFDGSVQFRLSQAFGYSVAGGATYGPNRLGVVTQAVATPEPTTLCGAGIGTLCLLAWGRNRRRRAA